MVHINWIDFNDKNNKRIRFDDRRRGVQEVKEEKWVWEARIKAMRTRIYLNAAAEDKK